MEVAYASFCGFTNIVISGPNLHHDEAHADGLPQYARAILEALSIGTYMSLSILLSMADHPSNDAEEVVGSLAPLAREEYMRDLEGENMRKGDLFGTWDTWHTIRSVCKYNQRLFVGKNQLRFETALRVLGVSLHYIYWA